MEIFVPPDVNRREWLMDYANQIMAFAHAQGRFLTPTEGRFFDWLILRVKEIDNPPKRLADDRPKPPDGVRMAKRREAIKKETGDHWSHLFATCSLGGADPPWNWSWVPTDTPFSEMDIVDFPYYFNR